MFEYLDVLTSKLVKKIAASEFYQTTQNKKKRMPLLENFLNQNIFWSDLCYFHFKIHPKKEEDAKNVFIAQYLLSIGNYKKAAAYGSTIALFKMIEHYIAEKKFKTALKLGKRAADKFGILGNVFYLFVCQRAMEELQDKRQKRNIAKKGLVQLDILEHSLGNEVLLYEIKNTSWHETIESIYGGYPSFIEQGRIFFKQDES